MRRTASIILVLAALLVLSGCLIIKDDRGLHKGHYKQAEKNRQK